MTLMKTNLSISKKFLFQIFLTRKYIATLINFTFMLQELLC